MSRIELRIEQLVLKGVPAHQAGAVTEALRAELARALAEDPALAERLEAGRAAIETAGSDSR